MTQIFFSHWIWYFKHSISLARFMVKGYGLWSNAQIFLVIVVTVAEALMWSNVVSDAVWCECDAFQSDAVFRHTPVTSWTIPIYVFLAGYVTLLLAGNAKLVWAVSSLRWEGVQWEWVANALLIKTCQNGQPQNPSLAQNMCALTKFKPMQQNPSFDLINALVIVQFGQIFLWILIVVFDIRYICKSTPCLAPSYYRVSLSFVPKTWFLWATKLRLPNIIKGTLSTYMY